MYSPNTSSFYANTTDDYDVAVIGSGMGALSAAGLLAKQGLRVLILEQNYLPGGCTSAYWRKGFVFESGATTLVGLGNQMPLQHLVDALGIKIPARKLELPMQVHLRDGRILNRYQDLEAWIAEAERVFGVKNQRPFWEFCYRISQFVWQTSLKQTAFPPARLSDLWQCALRATPEQVRLARYAFFSTQWLLKHFGLDKNDDFVDFINEQLLITAQNHAKEVNVLFGATALCYTNYDNYYVDGGLINLVNPIIAYVERQGGACHLREAVQHVRRAERGYVLRTDKAEYRARFVISGVPLNNTLALFEGLPTNKYTHQVLDSESLNSAFQMGIGFKNSTTTPATIHHQIHLPKALTGIGAASIFLSINHPDDHSRCDEAGHSVASVSTHLPDPGNKGAIDKSAAEAQVLDILEQRGFLKREHIVYMHSSTQKSWEKWTGRAFGFVGGYPQWMRIKPWQMVEARLDGHGAYLCGDTTYPGQGIPGTVLSGIIAAEKLLRDWPEARSERFATVRQTDVLITE